jgi:hypothetical protein
METPTHHPGLEWLLAQRCFLLFVALLALMLAIPFLGDTLGGRRLVGFANLVVLVTAVAAVERARLSLLLALLLGVSAFGLQLIALASGEAGYAALSWGFNALFYLFTLGHLLHYVLRRDVMTGDKLYGAVAAYMMIGITWAFAYGVLQYFHPGAFALHGDRKALGLDELIFFSFVVLTSTGFGDITPMLTPSRFLAILESMTGVMYVAILIARLTGVYPVVDRKN